MKKYAIAILLSISGFTSNIFSQVGKDSTRLTCNFDIEAQEMFHLQGVFFSVRNDIANDIWGKPILPKSNGITDNPFRHAAFYGILKSETSMQNKYKLDLDIVMEHRGMSYGVNDMDNIIVYPTYKFDIQEKFRLFDDHFRMSFQLGYFKNNTLHQGLKIYNIDTQGADVKFSWKNFYFQYHEVGDLSYGVGLELEELSDFGLGYAKLQLGKGFQFGFIAAINAYAPQSPILKIYDVKKYNTYGLEGAYSFSDKAKVYFQYELRNAPYFNVKENSAFLVGARLQANYRNLSFSLNPEFRYYGWAYNYGHRNDSVSYRKEVPDKTFSFSNTVGRYLYPLMNYNNPFSQWAVYTDYQYQNIAGLEFRGNMQWRFSEKVSAKIEAESCTFFKEYATNNKKTFTYLFYSAYFIYHAGKYINAGIGLGNKAMNLDKHFQTFYMSKQPFLEFFIRKEILH